MGWERQEAGDVLPEWLMGIGLAYREFYQIDHWLDSN